MKMLIRERRRTFLRHASDMGGLFNGRLNPFAMSCAVYAMVTGSLVR